MASTDSCAETSNASKAPSKATKILIMQFPSQKWGKCNKTKILFSEIAGKIPSSQRQKLMAGGHCHCLFSMTPERPQRATLAVSRWGTTQTVSGSLEEMFLSEDGHNFHLVLRLQKPERWQWLRQVWASFWHATQRSYTQVALWWWSCHPLSLEFTFSQGQPVKEPKEYSLH